MYVSRIYRESIQLKLLCSLMLIIIMINIITDVILFEVMWCSLSNYSQVFDVQLGGGLEMMIVFLF